MCADALPCTFLQGLNEPLGPKYIQSPADQGGGDWDRSFPVSGLRFLPYPELHQEKGRNKHRKGKCAALRMALVCPLCLWRTSHRADPRWHEPQKPAACCLQSCSGHRLEHKERQKVGDCTI